MDIKQIFTAMNLFYDKYGCLPKTSNTSCATTVTGGYTEGGDEYGYDNSYIGTFVPFLVNAGFMSSIPRDPVNSSVEQGYRYYCYNPPYLGRKGLWLDYMSETKKTRITENTWNDETICK
jgi:hypothetical protein